jgi:hypothetical protein
MIMSVGKKGVEMFKPVITTKGKKIYSTQECGRCDGSGVFKWPTMNGIQAGTCFRCGGSGVDPQRVRIDEFAEAERAKAREYREKAKAKKAAAAEAEAAATAAKNETEVVVPAYQERPETIVAMISSDSGILADMFEKLLANGSLSVKQWAFADKLAADRKVTPAPAPVGRQTIKGVVVKTKTVESQFGVNFKMVVKGDGFMVYGSIPSSILSVEAGDTVQFTATFEQSKDDQTFGFFKRPSKAEILETKQAADQKLQEEADKATTVYIAVSENDNPISDACDTEEEAKRFLKAGAKVIAMTKYELNIRVQEEMAMHEDQAY